MKKTRNGMKNGKKEFKIMGRYRGMKAEQVDTAETEIEANYLLDEYRLAYGRFWNLWIA